MTTYTDPGDRVLLIEPPAVAKAVGSPRRPSPVRLEWSSIVEAVTRLGRGTSTRPAPTRVDPAVPHSLPATVDPAAESGPGLDDPDRTVPISADLIAALDETGPTEDRFDLIIATVGAVHPGHGPVADWAHSLTTTGTLAVITYSDRTYCQVAGPSRDLQRAAELAGMALADRLILLHEPPSSEVPASDQQVVLRSAGHRRIHSTVLVFRARQVSKDREADNA